VRQRIADECGISITSTKTIVNAIICGMRFIHFGGQLNTTLINIISEDKSLTTDQIVSQANAVCNSDILKNMRSEVKLLWVSLKPKLVQRYHSVLLNKDFSERKLSSNCGSRWDLYFKLEAKVLSLTDKWLKNNDIKLFKEHDGWSTDLAYDVEELQQHIKSKIGISIKISYDCHNVVTNRLKPTKYVRKCVPNKSIALLPRGTPHCFTLLLSYFYDLIVKTVFKSKIMVMNIRDGPRMNV
jgi:hypothetical protein